MDWGSFMPFAFNQSSGWTCPNKNQIKMCNEIRDSKFISWTEYVWFQFLCKACLSRLPIFWAQLLKYWIKGSSFDQVNHNLVVVLHNDDKNGWTLITCMTKDKNFDRDKTVALANHGRERQSFDDNASVKAIDAWLSYCLISFSPIVKVEF